MQGSSGFAVHDGWLVTCQATDGTWLATVGLASRPRQRSCIQTNNDLSPSNCSDWQTLIADPAVCGARHDVMTGAWDELLAWAPVQNATPSVPLTFDSIEHVDCRPTMLLGSPVEPWSGTMTVTGVDADAGTADLTVDVAGASGDVPNVTFCPLQTPGSR